MNRISDYFLKKWEFLPSYLLHFPTVFIYLFFSAKSRSFLFFTNVSSDYQSSDIENSSKYKVYQRLRPQYYPKTLLIRKDEAKQRTAEEIKSILGIDFPFILKPNIGKRGLGAVLVSDPTELSAYFKEVQYDILVHEYIDAKHECGIFYIKYPHEEKAAITSIGLKKLPAITGDGHSNLESLLEKYDVQEHLRIKLSERFDLNNKILGDGEELVIEPIGSHNRGAQIYSANHLIDENLLSAIEDSIEGLDLYYGRLDIKFESWEELLSGHFKIIEVNTITSEPLSIYDARIPISKKYQIIYRHIKSMYEISSVLRNMGRPILNAKLFINYLFNYRAHLKRISQAKV